MSEQSSVASNPTHDKIMQIGMGFWLTKALLAAVHFELFTKLSGGKKMSAAKIKSELGLKTTDRHVFDWLDVLHGADFLNREGLLENALYSNTIETEIFLDKNKPSYVGGMLNMANNRLYKFWGDLEEGLLSGQAQNESKDNLVGGGFELLYSSPEKLQEFMDAMSGIQSGNFMMLAKKFRFEKYKTLTDVGGADGWLSIQLCMAHPDLHCTTFDLPQVETVAKNKIEKFQLSDRIKVVSGDFFKDAFPTAEIITMGNILHGMNEEAKQETVNKVYAALPEGGVFIAIESLIDDERKQNLFGMLMSLNMLIENGDAFDYTPTDFNRWAQNAGFRKTEFMPLTGPSTASVAYK